MGSTTAKPCARASALNCVASGWVPTIPSIRPWKSNTSGMGVVVPGTCSGGTVIVYRRVARPTLSPSGRSVTGPRVVVPQPGDGPVAPAGGFVVTRTLAGDGEQLVRQIAS